MIELVENEQRFSFSFQNQNSVFSIRTSTLSSLLQEKGGWGRLFGNFILKGYIAPSHFDDNKNILRKDVIPRSNTPSGVIQVEK